MGDQPAASHLCLVADESTKLSRPLARRSRTGVQKIRRQSTLARRAARIEHCKLEIAHMDFGFMQLMKYVG
jgi:hypothetical protein